MGPAARGLRHARFPRRRHRSPAARAAGHAGDVPVGAAARQDRRHPGRGVRRPRVLRPRRRLVRPRARGVRPAVPRRGRPAGPAGADHRHAARILGSRHQAGRRLPESTCYPRPGPVPIIVGGGGERRTLQIAARLADGCNLNVAPAACWTAKLRCAARHLAAAGRFAGRLRGDACWTCPSSAGMPTTWRGSWSGTAGARRAAAFTARRPAGSRRSTSPATARSPIRASARVRQPGATRRRRRRRAVRAGAGGVSLRPRGGQRATRRGGRRSARRAAPGRPPSPERRRAGRRRPRRRSGTCRTCARRRGRG